MEPLSVPMKTSRRQMLKLGLAGGVAWLTGLAELLADDAERKQRKQKHDPRPKSVILLWLEGGPSQLETFDPHPGTKISGGTKAIRTAARGIRLAEGFERLAEQMQSVALVRSLVTQEGDHERGAYLAKTGYRPNPTVVHPSLGAICCHELEVGKTEIPRHISILDSAFPGRGGLLGARYDAFKVGDPANPVRDITAWVGPDRLRRRLDDLELVNQRFVAPRKPLFERHAPSETISAAVKMMHSEQLTAFDVMQEPRAVRERYGNTPFGRGCLAARRLIEVGVRCVEVNLSGWDSHVDNHSVHRELIRVLDPAFAALLSDLRERDLLDHTIVICAGEFGRTPRINSLDGRDHWTHGFSVALAGGAIRGGVVVGQTDPEGRERVSQPHRYGDIHATVLAALGLDIRKEYISRAGRPIRLSDGKPIASLLNNNSAVA